MERVKKIVGQTVILEDLTPKYFDYIIDWRNNRKLNRFLNQPFVLTREIEEKWYEKYCKDDTQALYVMIDKSTNIPFGTMGYTDLDLASKRCIAGRLLVGSEEYRASLQLVESFILWSDYLYSFVDVSYGHVAVGNRKVLSLNKKMGYAKNTGEIQYPEELFVNGLEQIEIMRSKEMFARVRDKYVNQINILIGSSVC